MPIKILTVIGTRPHFVKAAMVSRALQQSHRLEEVLVHTGQHYDYNLSEAFFTELDLPRPAYQLDIGSGRQAWQLGSMITALDEVIEREQPAAVIVYGDTNTTAAGAIAAAKSHILLAHIEAGLREFDKSIPEEVNKLLIDAVADLYLCPTATAVTNLQGMGITTGVHLTGDVGIDLVRHLLPRIEANHQILDRLGVKPDDYFLLTCHRAANTDHPEKLAAILKAAADLPGKVIFPTHPRTVAAVRRYGLETLFEASNLIVVDPLPFLDTQALIRQARFVITDSGGIIKEAYYHHTPGVIIDTQTEWIETVDEGWNYVAGPDREKILDRIATFTLPRVHTNCLGDGHAAERIVKILEESLYVQE